MTRRIARAALVIVLGLAAGLGFLLYQARQRHDDAHQRMRGLPSARLGRLVTGVRSVLVEHGTLPASAPLTPPLGACCPAGTCQPDPRLWEAPAWKALGFSVDEPHAYSYELVVAPGVGFTARALGDLDCDGTYATFEQIGVLGTDGVQRSSWLESE